MGVAMLVASVIDRIYCSLNLDTLTATLPLVMYDVQAG